jgi:hypothetical protein
MEITERQDLINLAHVLFTSPLQELDRPTPAAVRAAVSDTLDRCGGNCASCAARVAQEAGDHPESYQRRMRWALAAVHDAYQPALLLAS